MALELPRRRLLRRCAPRVLRPSPAGKPWRRRESAQVGRDFVEQNGKMVAPGVSGTPPT